MIIGEDSPYRKLPAELNRRQMLFFDGIRYSIDMADLAYEGLRRTLFDLTVRKAQGDTVDHWQTTSAVQDAWSMVDSLHRLRGLLAQMPGWKNKASGAQVFERHTRTFEDLRNAVQHLNHEIENLVAADRPVWGSLNWLAVPEPETNHAIMCWMVAGTLFSGPLGAPMQVPGGKEVDLPIDLISLSAHGHSVDLSGAMKQVARLVVGTEDQLREQFEGHPTAGADLFTFVTVKFGEEDPPDR